MGSDLLAQHKQLTKKLEEARDALQKAENALFENELSLLKAVRENPLMQHIGLLGPESDLSDYIGSELCPDSRPTLRKENSHELFSNSLQLLDPSLSDVVDEDPVDTFFSTHPCLDLSAELSMVSRATQSNKSTSAQGATFSNSNPLVVEDLNIIVPEDSLRSTLALASIGVAIWDWDVVHGTIYTCSRWKDLIGVPDPSAEPLDILLEHLDHDTAIHVKRAVDLLEEGTYSSFCMRVQTKPVPSARNWVELHGIAVRNTSKDLLRIVISAIDVSHDHCFGLDLKRCLESLESSSKDKSDFSFIAGTNYEILEVSGEISLYFFLKDESVGKFLHEVVGEHDAYFFEENIQGVASTGLSSTIEAKLWSPFTGSFTAECTFTPNVAKNNEAQHNGTHNNPLFIPSVTVEVKDLTKSLRMIEEYYALFNNVSEGYALFKYDEQHTPVSSSNVDTDPLSNLQLIAMNPVLKKAFKAAKSNPFTKASKNI